MMTATIEPGQKIEQEYQAAEPRPAHRRLVKDRRRIAIAIATAMPLIPGLFYQNHNAMQKKNEPPRTGSQNP